MTHAFVWAVRFARRHKLGRRAGVLALLAGLTACQAAQVAPPPSPAAAQAGSEEQVVKLTAKRFEYSQSEIHVKRGIPVVLEITAMDHDHGFALRAFKLQADLDEGKTVRLRFIPDKTGRFEFHCDNYCGDFHESMEGFLIVE